MNLQLSLKKQWFEMTKAGIKTEDYREVNIYWFKRLIQDYKYFAFNHNSGMGLIYDSEVLEIIKNQRVLINGFLFKEFTTNTMTLGYPKSTDSERIIRFKHAGIEIREGNPDWGAEPNKLYFVIKHGDKL